MSWSIASISTTVSRMKQADKAKLDAEYRRQVEGLRSSGTVVGVSNVSDVASANPVLPADVLEEAIPGILCQICDYLLCSRLLPAFQNIICV